LNTYLKRNNFEIITATDSRSVTYSNSVDEIDDSFKTFTEILIEICWSKKIDELSPDQLIFKEDFEDIYNAIENQAEKCGIDNPKPQYESD
jgi:hypothetical protein